MRSTSVKEISGELFDYNLESLIGIAKTKISKQLGRKPQNRDVLKQLNQMFDAETGEFKCPHSLAYAQFKARENYEKLNLVKLLKLELITEGHNLRDCTKTEATNSSYLSEIKQNKEEISDRYYEQMSRDREIPLDLAKKITNQASATKEDRRVARKAILRDRLPGVELTAPRLAKVDNPHWFNAIRLFWLYQNREALELYDRASWDRVVEKLEPQWFQKSDKILDGLI